MRDAPSTTAAWVAAARSLGADLPDAARLVDDPLGMSFASGAVQLVAETGLIAPLMPFVLYMQVRTRVIDDVLRRFAATERAAGRPPQVLLFGAGYDCRAVRFADELGDGTVFEVDFPATQAHKRGVLGRAPQRSAKVEYLPWNFEARSLDELPAALAERGHVAARPTLTIWEGVTMYLTEPAIETSVRAVGALSSPGSPFVVTYIDRRHLEKPHTWLRVARAIVAGLGEPFTFGWAPLDFAPWFEPRGWRVEWDLDMTAHANMLLPAAIAGRLDAEAPARRIALVHKA